jgi:hypothetical protein
VFVRHPACFVREEDEEGGFLFNPDTGKVCLLNPAAVSIWSLLDGKRTVADIVTELRASFTDTTAEMDQQVWDHLQALCTLGVVGTVGE